MKYLAAWCLALAAAVLLTVLVFDGEAPAWEADVIEAAQESPVPGLTLSNLVYSVTHTEHDLVVGVILALFLWRTGYRRYALVLAVLLALQPIVQHELKALVDRPRPPYDPDDLWSEPTSPAYPSGHVMSATVVYGWLLFCAIELPWRRAVRLLAAGLAVTVLVMTAVTVLYLGVHWPTDVLGGYLWGLVLLLPAIWSAKRWHSEGTHAEAKV